MKNRKTEAQKRKQRMKVMGEKMEKESKGSEGKFGVCTCSCEERQIGRQTDRMLQEKQKFPLSSASLTLIILMSSSSTSSIHSQKIISLF